MARNPHRPRVKTAAIGLVAGALVLLPLGQSWREHSEEAARTARERLTLDPLARAVAVQRGLEGHRAVAHRVLAGRTALEAERRLRAEGVSADLAELSAALVRGAWQRAASEAEALTLDWGQLARRVSTRQLPPAASDRAHTLLIEQTVQVMDLVSAQGTLPAGAAPWLALLRPQGMPPETAQAAIARASDPALLAAAHEALQQQNMALAQAAERHARASQRAGFGFGLALLSLAWLVTWAARPFRSTGPSGGPAGDGVRRSHGRRSTDRAPGLAGADAAWMPGRDRRGHTAPGQPTRPAALDE